MNFSSFKLKFLYTIIRIFTLHIVILANIESLSFVVIKPGRQKKCQCTENEKDD